MMYQPDGVQDCCFTNDHLFYTIKYNQNAEIEELNAARFLLRKSYMRVLQKFKKRYDSKCKFPNVVPGTGKLSEDDVCGAPPRMIPNANFTNVVLLPEKLYDENIGLLVTL